MDDSSITVFNDYLSQSDGYIITIYDIIIMYAGKVFADESFSLTMNELHNIIYSGTNTLSIDIYDSIVILGTCRIQSGAYSPDNVIVINSILIESTTTNKIEVKTKQNNPNDIYFEQDSLPSIHTKVIIHNGKYPVQNADEIPLTPTGTFTGEYPTNLEYNMYLKHGYFTYNSVISINTSFYLENDLSNTDSSIQMTYQTIDNIKSTYETVIEVNGIGRLNPDILLDNFIIESCSISIPNTEGNITTITTMTSNYIDLSQINNFSYVVTDNILEFINDNSMNVVSCLTKQSYDSTIGSMRLDVPFIRPRITNNGIFTKSILDSLKKYKDDDNSQIFAEQTMSRITPFFRGFTQTITFNIKKTLNTKNFNVEFWDETMLSSDYVNSTWNRYLNIPDFSYNLSNVPYYTISTHNINKNRKHLIDSTITFSSKTGIEPLDNSYNDIIINIPENSYTIQDLFSLINDKMSNIKDLSGSIIKINNNYTQFEININRAYTASDYNIVFYDIYSFIKCTNRIKNLQNVSWNDTLGWFLGFRKQLIYSLDEEKPYTLSNSYAVGRKIIADTIFTNNIYNYFLIKLDDYTQSHLNDGLITIGNDHTTIYDSNLKTVVNNQVSELPNYITEQYASCNPATGKIEINNVYSNGKNQLTNNQVYAAQQILNAKQKQQNNRMNYSKGPYIQDLFGFIPIKTTGVRIGDTIVDSGGPLQNQNRLYFGPVNIRRMTVSLLNDKGDLLDLNGANWSFSLVCEQLYQQKSLK